MCLLQRILDQSTKGATGGLGVGRQEAEDVVQPSATERGYSRRGQGLQCGISWISGQNLQIQHCLLAACSSNRTGNLQSVASTGEQLAAG